MSSNDTQETVYRTIQEVPGLGNRYVGRCSECSAFLRRPYDAEEKQFHDFMDWKARHMEAGR